MKSVVTMTRKMEGFDILQRTSDGYFNASALLEAWNSNNSRRRMDRFLNAESTGEFIKELVEQSEKQSDSHWAKVTNGDFQAVTIVKGRTTNKGKTKDTVWMHPFLFIDFAMWLNPRFKYHVIKFVYDNLIAFRHDAGDNYKTSCKAVGKLIGVRYDDYAKALNWCVFKDHYGGIRNNATEAQLAELAALEKEVEYAIKYAGITRFDAVLEVLRRKYEEKYLQVNK